MKILMLIGQYYPIVGGAEKQAQKLSEELVKQGCEVDVVTYWQRGLKKFEIINGIKVYRLRGFLYKNIREYSLIFSLLLFIWKNRNEYDVIHCHQALLPAFSGVLAGKIFKIPSIVKIAVSGYLFDLNVLQDKYIVGKNMQKFLCLNADKFIAIESNIISEIKNSCGNKNVELIPNGIDLKHNYNKNDRNLNMIIVARLRKQKNISFILKVLSSLNINYQLDIYGDGKERENLEKIINKKTLQNNVVLHGNTESDIVYKALEKSSIFLLPSFTEGLSNALLEAMAFGVVPIVSDIPGNRFALGEELSKELVLSLHEKAWVEKIYYLYNNQHKLEELSKKVRERAKFFDISNIAKQYIKLYKELANDKNNI